MSRGGCKNLVVYYNWKTNLLLSIQSNGNESLTFNFRCCRWWTKIYFCCAFCIIEWRGGNDSGKLCHYDDGNLVTRSKINIYRSHFTLVDGKTFFLKKKEKRKFYNFRLEWLVNWVKAFLFKILIISFLRWINIKIYHIFIKFIGKMLDNYLQ